MIEQVLVAMDDSEMAERALEYALEVHPDAEISVLYVAGEPSPMMGRALEMALEDDIEEVAREEAESIFESARKLAGERGIDLRTDVDVGSPAKSIIERSENFDAVVLGSHGGDLRSRLLMGNVAERVTRAAPVPVTVVR